MAQSNPIPIPHPSGQTGYPRRYPAPRSALESRHAQGRQPAPTKEEREKDVAERRAKYVADLNAAKLIQQKQTKTDVPVEPKKTLIEKKKRAMPVKTPVPLTKPTLVKPAVVATPTKQIFMSNPQTISNEITKKTSSLKK